MQVIQIFGEPAPARAASIEINGINLVIDEQSHPRIELVKKHPNNESERIAK
jgi:hypothetical protein